MSLSVPNTAKAVLIGASNFPKDDTLSPIEQAGNNIKSIAKVLADKSITGLDEANIVKMLDVADNTKIKEEVSIAAEEAQGAMLVYITGHITTRKGHLYLATPNSSRKKIHINGIALDELLDIISETNAETRILIFDAYYSDVNDEETEGGVVVDALKYYESAYLNTFILSASPSSNFNAFKGEGGRTSFTEALLNTLANGFDKEQEALTLEDIYEGIKEKMTGQVPLKSTASKADKITVAYNTKFLGFRELKNKADQLFDNNQFQEALNAYEEAIQLFGKNEEVKKRKKFIKRFLEGEKAIEKGNFEKAKQSFLEAQYIFDMNVVNEKINGVVMTIANTLFDKEEFELARENYKMVAAYKPNDNFIKERLEKCDHELRFLDFIDEADRHYFEDDFAKALEFYNKALEIHPDRKATKRKEECERLLHKADVIRQQLIKEQEKKPTGITAEQRAKLEKDLRRSIETELRIKLEDELASKFQKSVSERLTAQENNFNEKLWSNVSLANSLDVYEFFIQYYPESPFIEKAKERLDQLSSIVRKQKERTEKKPEEQKPAVSSKEAEEKAKELQEKRADASKKHKPFIKEEKGRSHISEEKPYDILEELEAQFNSKKKEKTTPKVEESKPKKSPEDIINEVIGDDSVVEKKEEDPNRKKTPEEMVNEALRKAAEKSEAKPKEEEKKEEDPNRKKTPEEMVNEALRKAAEKSEAKPKEEEKKEEDPNRKKTPEEMVNEALSKAAEKSEAKPKEEEKNEEDSNKKKTPDQLVNEALNKAKEAEKAKVETPEKKAKPIPPIREEEKQLSEEELWQKAVQSNSLEGYRYYVDNTKESEHLVDAYYQINKLSKMADAGVIDSEMSSPIETKKQETPPVVETPKEKPDLPSNTEKKTEEVSTTSYNSDVSNSSSSDAPSTTNESSGSDEDTLWQKATEANTVNAYYEYVANSKEKRYLEQAKERISSLKENARESEKGDWETAEAENTIDAYKQYIKKYPLGHYYAKAMFRISELEAQI